MAFPRLARAAAVLSVAPLLAAAPAGRVTVTAPWFRIVTAQTPAGGYMQVHNLTDHQVILTGVSSPACGMAMMHRTEGDAMAMVTAIPIQPGATLAFAPGGYHIMCMSPHMSPGGTVPVTLHFDRAPALTTAFAVIGATGQPPHTGD